MARLGAVRTACLLIGLGISALAGAGVATNAPPAGAPPFPIPGWRAYAKPDGAMKTPPGYPRSPFTPYRDAENWQFLADPTQRTNWYDALKFIPLGDRPDWFLTAGGEAREKYEHWNNWAFGLGPQDHDGYFLQRYLLHGDAHLGPGVRLFAQMQTELESGRTGGPRPTDENYPDLLQAFVDLTHRFNQTASVTLRAGRQELAYGGARLLDIRENANVRLPFDGLRTIVHLDKTEIDLFATRVVSIKPHRFDTSGPDWSVWGAYLTRELPGPGKMGIDAYYLGMDRAVGPYFAAKGAETRHTLGARYFGTVAGFDFEVEGGYQFGELASQTVRSWFASGQAGYFFKDLPGAPRLGLALDAFSGDAHRGDNVAGTFNSFFPRAPYWDETPLIGQQNMLAAHPRLTWRPFARVTLNISPIWYWRESTDDGIYNFGGAPLIAPNGNRSRAIGQEVFTKVTWQMSDTLSLNFAYQHFFRGGFLKSVAGTGDPDYVAAWATFRF